jgi:hypothetical protein
MSTETGPFAKKMALPDLSQEFRSGKKAMVISEFVNPNWSASLAQKDL